MILSVLLYMAVCLNCFLIGRIIAIDERSNADFIHCCTLALLVCSFNIVVFVAYICVKVS